MFLLLLFFCINKTILNDRMTLTQFLRIIANSIHKEQVANFYSLKGSWLLFISFSNSFLFICKKNGKREKVISHSLIHPELACNRQGGALLQVGAGTSTQILHLGDRDPATLLCSVSLFPLLFFFKEIFH